MPSKNNIWWFCVVLAILVCVFFIGRNSKKDIVTNLPTDTSKYEKKIDSLIVNNRLLKIENIKLSTKFDSLSQLKINNHKKVKSDVEKIKFFTPTSRERFRDSVAKSNGLR